MSRTELKGQHICTNCRKFFPQNELSEKPYLCGRCYTELNEVSK